MTNVELPTRPPATYHQEMRLLFLFLLFLPLFAEAAPSACQLSANSPACQSELNVECRKQKMYLLDAVKRKVSAQDIVDRAIDSKRPVVLFGESHGERSAGFFRWALARMKEKRPELDCVLIEQPQAQYGAAFAACNAKKDCVRRKLPEFSGVKEGLDLGFKVFAIDAVPDMAAKEFLKDVDRRNEHMAHATAKLLETRTCHGAVVIVGALHAHLDSRLTSVPQRLKSAGVASYKIELLAPGFTNFGSLDPRWTWTDAAGASVCQEVAGPVAENFGFLNTGTSAKLVRSFYGAFSSPGSDQREFSGAWGDYEASLVIGCADPMATSCEPYRPDEWTLTNKTYLTPPK